MANEENIDDIVSSGAIKSIYDAEKALKVLYDQLQKDITAAHALNQSLGGSNSIKDFNKVLNDAKLAQEKVAKAAAATQLQEERLAAFRANEANKEEARQKRLQKVRNDGMGAGDYNPYKELSKQYDEAAKKAQDLGAQLTILKAKFGENPSVQEAARLKALSNSFEDASRKAAALGKQLGDIDGKVLKFGRNVGNYKSGWNGLSNSINQISRELPAFTYSIKTGFMALSNNIPILFDEINKTKLEIAALRAEGKQVPGLFKQIMSSVFSWGTALSIGITLLTVFGKEIGEFIKSIFAGTKAMDYFTERQKVFHEVRRNGFKDAQTELVNMQNLKRAAENTSLAYGERVKAVNELQKQYPKTLGNLKDEDILAGKAGDAYKYLTQQILATAYASAASSKISENRLRSFDNEEKRTKARIDYMKEERVIETAMAKLRDPRNAAQARALASEATAATERRANAGKIIREANLDDEELNKRNLKLIKDIDDATKKYGVTVLGVNEDKNSSNNTDSIDLLIQRAKNRQTELKDIVENEKLKLQTRLDAVKEYEKATNDVATFTAQKELSEADLTKDKIKAINEQKAFDIKQSAKEAVDMQVSLQEQANKQLSDLLKEGIKNATDAEKAKIQALLDGQNSRMEAIEKDRSDATTIANEMLNSGKMKRKQYDAEIFAIEKQASIDRIKLEIDTIQAIIDIQKQDLEFGIGTQKELSDNEKKLSDYRIALSKAESATKNEIRDKDLEADKERFNQLKELGQELFNFSRQLVMQTFENRLEALSKEKEAIDTNKNLAIENVNESVLSEQTKAEQIAVINQNAANQQEALDQKVRETKRKQAIADKAFAIGQAIINGALAMTKVAAQTGILTFAFSPLIAALTAVQVAAIVAQPIPKFEKGGTVQKDGIIMTGEKGKELRIDPDGSKYLTAGEANLSFAKAGTKIFSANHPNTINMLAKPDKMDVAGKSWDISASQIVESQDRNAKELKKTIALLATKNNRRQNSLDIAKTKDWLAQNGMKGL